MKHEKERIDLLLDKNAAEQLTKVDWDRLTDEISTRLDQARHGKTSRNKYPAFFKIAAGVAAAAAVVFAAVMLRMHRPSDSVPTESRSAVVEFVDKRGAASIEIKQTGRKSLVTVRVGLTDKKVARCDVEIIDRNGDLKRDSSRAAWIIISIPRPTFANNGHNTEETDLIHFL
ncbi:MAG: hypothetical protein ACYSYV_11810 [Planctomycetota bacterium]|jgi:hypothetical protein